MRTASHEAGRGALPKQKQEVIMSNNTTIQEKALRAAANYLERRGFEVIDTEWVPEDGLDLRM